MTRQRGSDERRSRKSVCQPPGAARSAAASSARSADWRSRTGALDQAWVISNAAPADLFDRLGGRPQADGTWTGPSEMTGSYDPPTMAPGVYTYAIDAGSPCGAATATVTVTYWL